MGAFVRHRRSKQAIATFSAFEADLLRSLAAQLVELLRNQAAQPRDDVDPLEAMMDFSGPTDAPDDPVLARLFPTAYVGDDESAAEFRRFTEGTLRDSKARAAHLVIDTLEDAGLPAEVARPGAAEGDADSLTIDVELGREAAETWMRCLTDLRLALATRLGVEEDDEERWLAMPDDDPRAQAHDIYDWLGYLQETLIAAAPR